MIEVKPVDKVRQDLSPVNYFDVKVDKTLTSKSQMRKKMNVYLENFY